MIKQHFVIEDALLRRKRSKKKRILLINPPYCRPLRILQYQFNQGLGYIGAVLKDNGYDVAIYNSELELELNNKQGVSYTFENSYKIIKSFLNDECKGSFWEELYEVINNYDPCLVGISTLTNKATIVEKICGFIKSFKKELPIVLGGHHPTMFPIQMMKNKNVDFIIAGEGENKIIPLMEYINGDKNRLENIANIFYKDGEIIKGYSKKERITNLDNLPYPARETLLGYQEIPSFWFCAIITSRGCPFSCTYCGSKNVFGKKLIMRDPNQVVEEILSINNQFGTNSFIISDDTFNVNRDYAIELAKKIGKLSKKIRWSINVRLDLLDEEQLIVFRENGCSRVWVGVESGSNRILKEIKKDMTCDFIRRQTNIIKKVGIKWGGFFMIGFPDETKAEMFKTYEFMKELEPDLAQINILNPLPGTEIYENLYASHENSSDINWSLRSQASLDNLKFATNEKNIEDIVINISRSFDEYNYKKNNI